MSDAGETKNKKKKKKKTKGVDGMATVKPKKKKTTALAPADHAFAEEEWEPMQVTPTEEAEAGVTIWHRTGAVVVAVGKLARHHSAAPETIFLIVALLALFLVIWPMSFWIMLLLAAGYCLGSRPDFLDPLIDIRASDNEKYRIWALLTGLTLVTFLLCWLLFHLVFLIVAAAIIVGATVILARFYRQNHGATVGNWMTPKVIHAAIAMAGALLVALICFRSLSASASRYGEDAFSGRPGIDKNSAINDSDRGQAVKVIAPCYTISVKWHSRQYEIQYWLKANILALDSQKHSAEQIKNCLVQAQTILKDEAPALLLAAYRKCGNDWPVKTELLMAIARSDSPELVNILPEYWRLWFSSATIVKKPDVVREISRHLRKLPANQYRQLWLFAAANCRNPGVQKLLVQEIAGWRDPQAHSDIAAYWRHHGKGQDFLAFYRQLCQFSSDNGEAILKKMSEFSFPRSFWPVIASIIRESNNSQLINHYEQQAQYSSNENSRTFAIGILGLMQLQRSEKSLLEISERAEKIHIGQMAFLAAASYHHLSINSRTLLISLAEKKYIYSPHYRELRAAWRRHPDRFELQSPQRQAARILFTYAPDKLIQVFDDLQPWNYGDNFIADVVIPTFAKDKKGYLRQWCQKHLDNPQSEFLAKILASSYSDHFIKALGIIGDDKVATWLLERIAQDKNVESCARALVAIHKRTPLSEANLDRVTQLLNHSSPIVTGAAAYLAGEFGLRTAAAVVNRLLQQAMAKGHARPAAIAGYLKALGQIGNAKSIELLRKVLRETTGSGRDPERKYAAISLLQLRAAVARDDFFKVIFAVEIDAEVRAEIAWHFGRHLATVFAANSEKQYLSHIKRYYIEHKDSRGDSKLRQMWAQSLGALPTEKSVEVLAFIAQVDKLPVQQRALAALLDRKSDKALTAFAQIIAKTAVPVNPPLRQRLEKIKPQRLPLILAAIASRQSLDPDTLASMTMLAQKANLHKQQLRQILQAYFAPRDFAKFSQADSLFLLSFAAMQRDLLTQIVVAIAGADKESGTKIQAMQLLSRNELFREILLKISKLDDLELRTLLPAYIAWCDLAQVQSDDCQFWLEVVDRRRPFMVQLVQALTASEQPVPAKQQALKRLLFTILRVRKNVREAEIILTINLQITGSKEAAKPFAGQIAQLKAFVKAPTEKVVLPPLQSGKLPLPLYARTRELVKNLNDTAREDKSKSLRLLAGLQWEVLAAPGGDLYVPEICKQLAEQTKAAEIAEVCREMTAAGSKK